MSLVSFQEVGVMLIKPVLVERRTMSSTNLSLSDSEGEFLLASNGCELWDAKFDDIVNSRPLNPGDSFNNLCTGGIFEAYEAGHQSMVAIPDPAQKDHFLIFHELKVYLFDSTGRRHIERGAILLTKVDISSSPPTVLFKNQDVIRDTMTYGGALNLVKHTSLDAWWLLVPLREEACFYRFLIDGSGIHGPTKQCIGTLYWPSGEGGGQSGFSPNGKKYVRWSTRDGIHIYDFDRSSGELSNFIDIPFTVDSIIFGGMSISPNSRFLYVTTLLDMYQYDLEAEDIEASQMHIASYDGHQSPGSCTFRNGQMAPDCKIYWSSLGACTELHVIHQPNERGRACDFRQHDFKRVSNSNSTMPYFPNYRLGTGEVCDSTLMVNVRQVVFRRPEVQVYPNPATHRVTIKLEGPDINDQIVLVNGQGQSVLRRMVHNQSEVTIDLNGVPTGLYYVLIYGKGRMVHSSKLVVSGD